MMDMSTEYLDMCCKARELQTKYAEGYRHGDYCCIPSENRKVVLMTANDGNTDNKLFFTVAYNFWVPTQDQLQAMLFAKKVDTQLKNINNIFHKFDYSTVNTWEKLWLSIVMYENYQKEWDKQHQSWRAIK